MTLVLHLRRRVQWSRDRATAYESVADAAMLRHAVLRGRVDLQTSRAEIAATRLLEDRERLLRAGHI